MQNLQQKIEHLKWLHSIKVTYYCSTQKDRENLLITLIKEQESSINKHKTLVNDNVVNKTLVNHSLVNKNLVNHKNPIKLNELTENSKNSSSSSSCTEARNLATGANSLDSLRNIVENFNGCELKNFANNTVFCDGQQDAKILLIGEAPGATEDEQGIPFCGESGQLLDAMLGTIGISRAKNAYITNTIFWRPPANRKPTPHEINICKPFVEKHIAIINPKLIILVGSTATTSMLGNKELITQVRQNNYHYINEYLKEPILTTAIFHPAYLLRQPMQKKATWFDLLKIKELLTELRIQL